MATISALLAGVLAGCGGATKTVTVTTAGQGPPTVSAPQPTTPTATATTTAPTANTGPSATATLPSPTTTTTSAPPITATPTAIVHLQAFRSPSGNIGCQLTIDGVRCDIQHRRWSPPPRPSSCQFDYGQGLQVYGRGRGGFVCAGDTALDPTGPVLAYGTGSVQGMFLCVSASSGMTCFDKQTGHGFWIAIQGYRAF